MVELVPIDAGQDGRADEDLAAGIGFAFAALIQGAGTGVDTLLADFECLEFGLEGSDALIEFGHGVYLAFLS